MKSADALSSLKDIEGVYGSFVVDGSGALTLRDLPAVIDNAALREAGPRISTTDNIAPAREAIRAYLEDRLDDALEAVNRVVELPEGATTLPTFPDGEDVYWTARLYTRLGRHDLGLAGFAAAVNQGYFCVPQFEAEPWLDPIRGERAFVEALARARERHRRAAEAFRAAGGPALLGVPA